VVIIMVKKEKPDIKILSIVFIGEKS